jgi:hypothetical protein
MGIKGASAAGCSIYVYVSVAWAGDLNSRAKGIANCTKEQVPAQLLGRVSSKGPPQYHQTSALPSYSVGWFVRLLKEQLSLHPVRFSTFVNHPLCRVRHEV